MYKYKVAEHFLSINGEGRAAGQLALFIRFVGCNLNCSYCDTKWANSPDCEYVEMTDEDIFALAKNSGIYNITLTGGEPLIKPNIEAVISGLCKDHRVEIETNGAADIRPAIAAGNENLTLTVDYKLPSSGMEKFMLDENFRAVRKCDTVKFVSGSRKDLLRAEEIIREFKLAERCAVYISPVFGNINPQEIVEFMLEKKLNGVNLQLQLHKFIWDPKQRGV